MRVFDWFRCVMRREPWWAEFWSGSTAMAWAWFSWSGPGRMEMWPSMQVLLRLGDDAVWAILGVGLGGLQLLALLLDRRWCRWGGAIVMGWFWAVLTLGVWMAVPGAPSAAVYAGWCGANLFSIVRLLRHHG